jgi:hypothetical protein
MPAAAEHPCHGGKRGIGDQPPLPMPAFRPGIGVEQENLGQTGVRQPGEHLVGIAVMQANVGQRVAFDRAEQLGHAIDERLTADEAARGMLFGARAQMLASTKSDLQLDRLDWRRKQALKFGRGRSAQVEPQPWQQAFEQACLLGPQQAAAATAEEAARATRPPIPPRLIAAHQRDRRGERETPPFRSRRRESPRRDRSVPTRIRHQARAHDRNVRTRPCAHRSAGSSPAAPGSRAGRGP